MKKILLLCLIMLLAACARPVPESPLSPEDSMAPWERMLAMPQDAPYRIQLSMRFGEEGDTRRVTALLWGNGQSPLRLDVMAGAGATIAKISEQPGEFLIFVPGENKAYYHDGPTTPLLNIGTPLPLNLGELAALLSGGYRQVFGEKPLSVTPAGENMEYGLDNPPGGLLSLDNNGLPTLWQLNGWQLKFAYGDEWPTLPKSLRLTSDKGKFAMILIKEREKIDEPFTSEQMLLALPPATPRLPVATLKQ